MSLRNNTRGVVKIFSDGAARGNPGRAAAAFAAFDPNGKTLAKAGKGLGKTTNNRAEYEGVLLALKWFSKTNWKRAVLHVDSELIANQLSGKYKIKNKDLLQLALQVKQLEKETGAHVFYKHVPRRQNKIADALVNRILDEE